MLDGKAKSCHFKPVTTSTTKRPFEPATLDDYDSENVDPAALFSPAKKSKSDGSEKPFRPFTFSLSSSAPMPPPATVPSRATSVEANILAPRTPLTAPAGRSPKRKAAGISKNRRVSAPFTRIDPPLASRGSIGLPFSLDAALNGTFSNAIPKNAGATIEESMPKNWFFDIYEDTPGEEAANLMEHSTLTLDLSTDEEDGKNEKDDRGKENMPPEGYDATAASVSITEPAVVAPRQVKKHEIVRRKISQDEMDDGERSPLSDLETESFIPEGLTKESHVIVDPVVASTTTTSMPEKFDLNSLFGTSATLEADASKKNKDTTPSKRVFDMPVVTADGDVKGDIIIWEDSPAS